MPTIEKNTPSPASSNVRMLNPAGVRVQPPADWRLEGDFGHMAFEAGEAGRLVRMADVLRWLQSSREIPRSDALEVLCDAMPAAVMGWLYWVRETAFAAPVPPTFTFGHLTTEQIADRKVKDRQNAIQAGLERERQFGRFGARPTMQGGLISLGNPEPTEPGLPALLKYLRVWWVLSKRRGASCDVLDDLKIRHATTLAIRLDKAHALWGYGSTATDMKADDMTKIEPPESWQIEADCGYMAFNEFPAGRLVALSDLVSWMIEKKRLPCGEVVSMLCNKILADGGGGWLYVVEAGQFAKPLANDYSFAWEPIVSFYETAAPAMAADRGALGLTKHLRAYWGKAAKPGSANCMGQEVLDPIAMPVSKAFELFGYGSQVALTATAATPPASVGNYSELVQHRKENEGAPWLDAHVDLMAIEIDLRSKQGQKGVRKGVGKELDISEARISELLKKERKRQSAAQVSSVQGIHKHMR